MSDGSRCGKHIIFVVDDDPAVTASLKFLLEIEGYSVTVFIGGADLLNSTLLPVCDCLVVDHHMPGMNGIDVIVAARARVAERGRKGVLPAILITSSPPEPLRVRAANAQAQIVEKPFTDKGVLEAVRTLLADPHDTVQ